MKTVAVIQARIGSTRLPGKVLLPLGDSVVLDHIIRRVRSARVVNEVVTAIPDTEADDVVELFASESGAQIYRGPESDVLNRIHGAAMEYGADIVVRVSADNPLIPPRYIEHAVERLQTGGLDYVTPSFERAFPPGLACEVMSISSLSIVEERATTTTQREHVTKFYRENADKFACENLVPNDVPGCEMLAERNDLRLTLDTAQDYEVIRQVYEKVTFDDVLPLSGAIACVDENELARINCDVSQRIV